MEINGVRGSQNSYSNNKKILTANQKEILEKAIKETINVPKDVYNQFYNYAAVYNQVAAIIGAEEALKEYIRKKWKTFNEKNKG
ncbi:hypothetical protein ABLO26_20785 [Neobacillus sp. 179-J 1A1 HS]|uniref:hypothetical protein n=1 Tax=Neobacillus driksii TaxID=3035913 RepID=UPI0035BC94C4